MGTVTLTCWECAGAWQFPRRRGGLPTRCPTCRRSEDRARDLARRARARGLRARAVQHDKHGWICVLAGSDYSLRDAYDIKWAAIDADADALAVAA